MFSNDSKSILSILFVSGIFKSSLLTDGIPYTINLDKTKEKFANVKLFDWNRFKKNQLTFKWRSVEKMV